MQLGQVRFRVALLASTASAFIEATIAPVDLDLGARGYRSALQGHVGEAALAR